MKFLRDFLSRPISCAWLFVLLVGTTWGAEILRYSPNDPKIREMIENAMPKPTEGHHLSVEKNVLGEWKAVKFGSDHSGKRLFPENPNVQWKSIRFKPESLVEICDESAIDGQTKDFVGTYEIICKAVTGVGRYSFGTFPNIVIRSRDGFEEKVAVLVRVRIDESNMGPSVYPMLQFKDPDGYHYFFEPVNPSEDRLLQLSGASPVFVTSISPAVLLQGALQAQASRQAMSRWGVSFALSRDGLPIGSATIGAFSSNVEARQMFEDCVSKTSTTPPRALRSEPGQRSVAWDDRLLLVRHNVMIDVRLTTTSFENVAYQIHSALGRRDTGVVVDYNKMTVPTIEDFGWTGSEWAAITNPRVRGVTALLDREGRQTTSDAEAVQLIFATEGCVMSRPLDVTLQALASKRNAPITIVDPEIEKAEEQRRLTKELSDRLTVGNITEYERNKTIIRLMNEGDASCVPVLIEHTNANHKLVIRQNAIRALGKIGDKRAMPCLVRILDKPVKGNISDEATDEALLRRHAVLAIGEIGDPSALPLLRRLAKSADEHQSVREFSEITIRKMEK